MEKRKVNNWIIFISILFVITLLGGVSGYIINYNSKNNDNVNDRNNENNKNNQDNKIDKTYELKRYTDEKIVLSTNNHNGIGRYKEYIVLYTVPNDKNNIGQEVLYYLKENKITKTRKSTYKYERPFPLESGYNYYCTENLKCIFDRNIEPNMPKEEYDVIRPIDNYYLVRKDNKFGLLDSKGKTMIECKYDYIDFDLNRKYLYAILNNKLGVININGNVIIDFIYDGIEERHFDLYEDIAETYRDYFNSIGEFEYHDTPYVVKIDNKYLFFVKKDNTYYVLNEDNKIVFQSEGTREYKYEQNLNKFIKTIKENETIKAIEFYDLNGKLLKTIDNVKSVISRSGTLYEMDNSKILYVDENLNTKTIENVYYEIEESPDGYYNKYYINNKMYVKKENNKFSFYSLENELIAKDINNYDSSGLYEGYIICKEENNKCAVINYNGKLITDFEYSLYQNNYSNIYLINSENYVLINGLNDTKSKCTVEKLPTESIYRIRDNTFTSYHKNFFTILYDNNCNVIDNQKNYSIVKTKSNYLVAKIVTRVKNNYKTTEVVEGYDIYDKDNNLIKYTNNDNVKLKEYLGEVDNKLFFIGNNTLYYIEL